ncbi:hypothetical protein PCH_Pc21g15620 [Penicillium rubens Wisconsin 54-1255]|uniref:Uncharacterized protein n=1 Tax=Penicillium rubens (strain ATCC 28089 / DSM 1075 / NRRL 1951 / Wisconsin 54-1255) TaxID=500485 RepID=B6HJW0_PENRW|nr:hypothetical protein PCH_Pc21g15620 [Penicillium rubens Wisconsin 54-1255]
MVRVEHGGKKDDAAAFAEPTSPDRTVESINQGPVCVNDPAIETAVEEPAGPATEPTNPPLEESVPSSPRSPVPTLGPSRLISTAAEEPQKQTSPYSVDELYATACGMKFAPDFIDNEAYSVSDHLIGLNLDRVVVLKGTIDEKSDAQRKKLTRRKKIEGSGEELFGEAARFTQYIQVAK